MPSSCEAGCRRGRVLAAAAPEAPLAGDSDTPGHTGRGHSGQRTGRLVRAIELAPAYVDLAIARWQMQFPDQPVTLADDGRDYDAVAAQRVEGLANAA